MNGIPMDIKYNWPQQYMAVCPTASDLLQKEKASSDACSFSISAYYRPSEQKVTFGKHCVLEHSENCSSIKMTSTSDAVKNVLGPLLSSLDDLVPKKATRLVRHHCGVHIPYHTAWKAVSMYRKEITFDNATSIQGLSDYLSKMSALNEGTMVDFQRKDDLVFHRAFLAPGVGNKAFKHLLPCIVIDACHMRSKQGGMIFAASGMTAEKTIYSLAIAVAPVENEDNWSWFLSLLVRAIPQVNDPGIFIMADRDKGLRAAQKLLRPLQELVSVSNIWKGMLKLCLTAFSMVKFGLLPKP